MINDYIIISNDCTGGFMYNNLQREYDNPFMWHGVFAKYFVNLINNFDTINFNKYKMYRLSNSPDIDRYNKISRINNKKDLINCLMIDDSIEIRFIHCIENKNYKVPKKLKAGQVTNIYVNNIDKYLKDKYDKRTQRMYSCNKKPIFIYHQNSICNTSDLELMLYTNMKYPTIILCKEKTYKINENKLGNNVHLIYVSKTSIGDYEKVAQTAIDYINKYS